MTQEQLKEKIGKSYLICGTALKDLEIINYLNDSYYNTERVFSNPFLQISAVMYYRSVVIDLYALFGPASNNNKYSLNHITLDENYWPSQEINERIKEFFEIHKSDIAIIKQLRHKEFAHHDFANSRGIKYNLNEIYSLNQLIKAALEIFKILGDAMDTEFAFETYNHNLEGLKELVEPHL